MNLTGRKIRNLYTKLLEEVQTNTNSQTESCKKKKKHEAVETCPECGCDPQNPEADCECDYDNSVDEGNKFTMALKAARDAGEDEFICSGKKYKVEDYDIDEEFDELEEAKLTLKQVEKDFADFILPEIPKNDKVAKREAWNNYLDSLNKDGLLTDKQTDTSLPKKFE